MNLAQNIIVGGGVAGAAMAIHLARQGKPVLLLEKELAPHHKVCGEFLSYEALYYLGQLGIDCEALGAVPITHLTLVHGMHSATLALSFPAMSLSRYRLDEALLDIAQNAGATVARGITVSSIQKHDDGWRASTDAAEFHTHSLYLAAGKHDLRSLPSRRGWQNRYIGFKMHYRLSEQAQAAFAHRVVVMLFDGGYAGFEPVENGVHTLCFVIDKAAFAKAGKRWDNVLARIPFLDEPLKDATPCWDKPLAVYRIPYGYLAREAQPGLYRLGDQMAVIPSFAGDGMAMALHTAAIAAMAPDAETYHGQVRRHLASAVRFASFLSLASTYGIGRSCLLQIARHPQAIHFLSKATRLQRKNIVGL